MSFKELFAIWGQSTRERSRNALEMANFEFRQRNMAEMQVRNELMQMLKWKHDTLRQMQKENQRIKVAYEKKYGKSDGYKKRSGLNQALHAYGSVVSTVKGFDEKRAKHFSEFINDQWNPLFDKTREQANLANQYSSAFSRQATELSQLNKSKLEQALKMGALSNHLKTWNTFDTTGDTAYDKSSGVFVYDLTNDLWGAISGLSPTLSQTDVRDTLEKVMGKKLVTPRTAAKAKKNKKKKEAAWKSSDLYIEGSDLEDNTIAGVAYNNVMQAKNWAPAEVKPDIDRLIHETTAIQTGIGDIEKKLEEADVTPFDYDDIQRRAGQILIKQEEPEEIGKLPDDEAAYARSLPEAFKYAGKKSLSEYGTVGNFVDKMFEAQEKNPAKRKPWAELITAAKKETADPAQYRTAVAMMASRLLRAVEESGD